jgi:hypothetical protein
MDGHPLGSVFKFRCYSISQNNVPFPPPDNFVWVGKNSPIKARKREQGWGFLEYGVID